MSPSREGDPGRELMHDPDDLEDVASVRSMSTIPLVVEERAPEAQDHRAHTCRTPKPTMISGVRNSGSHFRPGESWYRLDTAMLGLSPSETPYAKEDPPFLDLSRPLKDQITARFLRSCRRLGPMPLFSSVYLVHATLVAKFGPRVNPSEAAALIYAREVAGITEVPRVVEYYKERESGHWCIVMERIKGMTLEVKQDEYTDQERDHVTQQLRTVFAKMRMYNYPKIASLAIGPKGSFVPAGVTDRFFLDGRNGPFKNESTFASALHDSLHARTGGYNTECVGLLLHHLFGTSTEDPPFVLANAALGPHNILVDGSRVVGILSWSQAGFYPVYWEYVKASFWDEGFFDGKNVIANALDPYFVQLSVLLHARDIVW